MSASLRDNDEESRYGKDWRSRCSPLSNRHPANTGGLTTPTLKGSPPGCIATSKIDHCQDSLAYECLDAIEQVACFVNMQA